jgi:hypothetical protein
MANGFIRGSKILFIFFYIFLSLMEIEVLIKIIHSTYSNLRSKYFYSIFISCSLKIDN